MEEKGVSKPGCHQATPRHKREAGGMKSGVTERSELGEFRVNFVKGGGLRTDFPLLANLTCFRSAFPCITISQKEVIGQKLNGRGKSGETKVIRTLSETNDFLLIPTVQEGYSRMTIDTSCGFLESRFQNPWQTLCVNLQRLLEEKAFKEKEEAEM